MNPKNLSGLEQKVMDIVWELDTCLVREVWNRLSKRKKLAYNTVATLLHRLYQKGFLTKSDKDSVIYYTPKLSKKDYGKNLAQSFINKFFGSFGDIAVASFADSLKNLSKEKRNYLLKLLEKHDKSK